MYKSYKKNKNKQNQLLLKALGTINMDHCLLFFQRFLQSYKQSLDIKKNVETK